MANYGAQPFSLVFKYTGKHPIPAHMPVAVENAGGHFEIARESTVTPIMLITSALIPPSPAPQPRSFVEVGKYGVDAQNDDHITIKHTICMPFVVNVMRQQSLAFGSSNYTAWPGRNKGADEQWYFVSVGRLVMNTNDVQLNGNNFDMQQKGLFEVALSREYYLKVKRQVQPHIARIDERKTLALKGVSVARKLFLEDKAKAMLGIAKFFLGAYKISTAFKHDQTATLKLPVQTIDASTFLKIDYEFFDEGNDELEYTIIDELYNENYQTQGQTWQKIADTVSNNAVEQALKEVGETDAYDARDVNYFFLTGFYDIDDEIETVEENLAQSLNIFEEASGKLSRVNSILTEVVPTNPAAREIARSEVLDLIRQLLLAIDYGNSLIRDGTSLKDLYQNERRDVFAYPEKVKEYEEFNLHIQSQLQEIIKQLGKLEKRFKDLKDPAARSVKNTDADKDGDKALENLFLIKRGPTTKDMDKIRNARYLLKTMEKCLEVLSRADEDNVDTGTASVTFLENFKNVNKLRRIVLELGPLISKRTLIKYRASQKVLLAKADDLKRRYTSHKKMIKLRMLTAPFTEDKFLAHQDLFVELISDTIDGEITKKTGVEVYPSRFNLSNNIDSSNAELLFTENSKAEQEQNEEDLKEKIFIFHEKMVELISKLTSTQNEINDSLLLIDATDEVEYNDIAATVKGAIGFVSTIIVLLRDVTADRDSQEDQWFFSSYVEPAVAMLLEWKKARIAVIEYRKELAKFVLGGRDYEEQGLLLVPLFEELKKNEKAVKKFETMYNSFMKKIKNGKSYSPEKILILPGILEHVWLTWNAVLTETTASLSTFTEYYENQYTIFSEKATLNKAEKERQESLRQSADLFFKENLRGYKKRKVQNLYGQSTSPDFTTPRQPAPSTSTPAKTFFRFATNTPAARPSQDLDSTLKSISPVLLEKNIRGNLRPTPPDSETNLDSVENSLNLTQFLVENTPSQKDFENIEQTADIQKKVNLSPLNSSIVNRTFNGPIPQFRLFDKEDTSQLYVTEHLNVMSADFNESATKHFLLAIHTITQAFKNIVPKKMDSNSVKQNSVNVKASCNIASNTLLLLEKLVADASSSVDKWKQQQYDLEQSPKPSARKPLLKGSFPEAVSNFKTLLTILQSCVKVLNHTREITLQNRQFVFEEWIDIKVYSGIPMLHHAAKKLMEISSFFDTNPDSSISSKKKSLDTFTENVKKAAEKLASEIDGKLEKATAISFLATVKNVQTQSKYNMENLNRFLPEPRALFNPPTLLLEINWDRGIEVINVVIKHEDVVKNLNDVYTNYQTYMKMKSMHEKLKNYNVCLQELFNSKFGKGEVNFNEDIKALLVNPLPDGPLLQEIELALAFWNTFNRALLHALEHFQSGGIDPNYLERIKNIVSESADTLTQFYKEGNVKDTEGLTQSVSKNAKNFEAFVEFGIDTKKSGFNRERVKKDPQEEIKEAELSFDVIDFEANYSPQNATPIDASKFRNTIDPDSSILTADLDNALWWDNTPEILLIKNPFDETQLEKNIETEVDPSADEDQSKIIQLTKKIKIDFYEKGSETLEQFQMMMYNREKLLKFAKEYLESFIDIFSKHTAELEDRQYLETKLEDNNYLRGKKENLASFIEKDKDREILFKRKYKDLDDYYQSLPLPLDMLNKPQYKNVGKDMKIIMDFFEFHKKVNDNTLRLLDQAHYVRNKIYHEDLLPLKDDLLRGISEAKIFNLRSATVNDDLETLYTNFTQTLSQLQYWYHTTIENQPSLDLATVKSTLDAINSEFEEAYKALKTELLSMNPRPESFRNGGWQKFWQSKYKEFENEGKEINPGLTDFKDFVFDEETQYLYEDVRETIANSAKVFWDDDPINKNPFYATPTEEDIKFFGLKLPPATSFSDFDESKVFKQMTGTDFQDVVGYYESLNNDEEDNRDWRVWWENSGAQGLSVWQNKNLSFNNSSML